ncbi:MAG: ComF family protein [Dehalococcoidia bacterium]
MRSLGPYDGALAAAIRRMKYHGVSDIGRELGRWFEPLIEPGALLAPVPLHSRRERNRGFNQAGVLARAAAARRATVWQGLIRVRETQSQVGLSGAERRRNLTGAFAARGSAPAEVILIDDVTTTGSTLDECARTLREAGARSVRGLVMAHARPGWDR